MSLHRRVAISSLGLAATLGAGCYDPPIAGLTPTQKRVRTLAVPLTPSSRVDVLLVIDNTNQAVVDNVARGLPAMVSGIEERVRVGGTLDLHLGVITTDYGAGATGAPGCTPSGPDGGGDQGRLQAVGRHAPPTCAAPVGARYLRYRAGEVTEDNLPPGQDLVTTLGCMTAVGHDGCPFPHPLEATYAALRAHPEPGFLRDDAELYVLFVSGKDDGSAPPASDLFDPAKVAAYGYLDRYSRQTRQAVTCGSPAMAPPYADSNGPLVGCTAIFEGGRLFDLRRYTDLFQLSAGQGGLKTDPTQIHLAGLTGPTAPFQVILADPRTPPTESYARCGTIDDGGVPPCSPVLERSCRSSKQPGLVGEPALRLDRVIGAAFRNYAGSVCDDDYGPMLRWVIGSPFVGSFACMRDRFPRDASGQLVFQCFVTAITLNDDGSESRVNLPACDATRSNTPCWRFDQKPQCQGGISPDGVGFVADYGMKGGVPLTPPPRTSALVECATTSR